jgi:hypothetical protein
MEDRILGLEDKVDKLVLKEEDKQSKLKKYKQNVNDLWEITERLNLQILGTEEEVQTRE